MQDEIWHRNGIQNYNGNVLSVSFVALTGNVQAIHKSAGHFSMKILLVVEIVFVIRWANLILEEILNFLTYHEMFTSIEFSVNF